MSGANASGYLESRTMKTEIPSVKMVAIADDEAGQRIDNFLRTQLKGVPKSMIYRILRKGEVRVNKKRVKPEYKLEAGDEVRIPPVRVSEKEEEAVSPHLQKVAALADVILYEDDHILVLNKPSGTAVHGGSGLSFGVIEGLRALRSGSAFPGAGASPGSRHLRRAAGRQKALPRCVPCTSSCATKECRRITWRWCAGSGSRILKWCRRRC
ncbi:ribosomal large subunit pseudouridine synthase C [Klebsiella michiganensis]|nr:ribosomal large subunit pseudouridine synthase C [Klebsiella michiganensis]